MEYMVVYESMFGNTETVARAVAEGLGEHGDVELCEVSAAPAAVPADVALVVVGGPTHAFGMSRSQTRADAVEQGAPADATAPGLREWSTALAPGQHRLVATFDTRVGKVRHLPGSAARGAARVLRRRGYELVAAPQSFFVHDVTGPLLDGEAERATTWGAELARLVAQHTGAGGSDTRHPEADHSDHIR